MGSVLLCSCATTRHGSSVIPASDLPAEVTINKDAGRGNLVFVTLRLESGEELPFLVDTGTSGTVLDKSLEPKLGKRVGTVTMGHWGAKDEANQYAAPKLYLGSTTLMMSRTTISVLDFKDLSAHTGFPIMGALGMDVLGHYCIQLDFVAGKMRFLDSEHADKRAWGKAFPLAALNARDARPSLCENLFGARGPHSLIDTGYSTDGWLMPRYFQQWTNAAARLAKGEVHSPNGSLGGETYPQVSLREEKVESDGIGLPFLARHLVTLDFPRRMLYLKRTSDGPLAEAGAAAAITFLRDLKENSKLPGWSKDEHGEAKGVKTDAALSSTTIDVLKTGDTSIYHYTVTGGSNDSPRRLQKAWRTDQNDRTVEEYSIP